MPGIKDAIGNIQIKGPAQAPEFSGTVEHTAPFLPGNSPGISQTTHVTPGLPIWTDLQTGQPFPMDQFNLHAEGRTSGTVLMTLADRFWGKTTAAEHTAAFLGMRNTGGDPMRIMADIHRRNNGVPEMYKLAQFFDAETVPLSSYELNIFAAGLLNPSQAIDMAKDALELINKQKLTIDQYEALSIAMSIMYGMYAAHAGPSVLYYILDRMSDADLDSRHAAAEQKFMEANEGNQDLQALLNRPRGDVSDTVRAARQVSKLVRRLADKTCFGDKNSLAVAMQQRFFAPDYTGLTDEELVLIQAYVWRVKTLAVMEQRKDLFFNIEIHDENYKLCKYVEYIRPFTEFLKAVRGVQTLIWINTHRLADYSAVGAVGSVQYQLAQNMIDDVDQFLIGRQPESARADLVGRLGMSDSEFEYMKILPRFGWGFWMRSEGLRRITFTPTSAIMEASNSTVASDEMYIPEDPEPEGDLYEEAS